MNIDMRERAQFLITILLVLSFNIHADIEGICSSEKVKENQCLGEGVESSLPDVLNIDSFKRWRWLQEMAAKKRDFLQAEIDNNKGMLRFLRDSFVEDTENRDWYQSEFSQIKEDYKTLRSISKQIDIVSKKLNMCFKVCTPSMQIENEEHLRKLQELKMTLLSARPILAGPEIEEMVLEPDFNEDKFNEKLISTYVDYLSATQESIKEINDNFSVSMRNFDFANESRDEIREERLENFVKNLNGEFELNDVSSDLLSSIDWDTEVNDSDNTNEACFFFNENKNYIRNKRNTDLAVEVAMFTAPFVVGPMFRLGVWGLKGAKLLKWGMREELYANITKASAGAISGAYFVKDGLNISEKKEECREQLGQFVASKNRTHYQKYIECNEDLNRDILLLSAETSLVGFSSAKSIVEAIKVNKGFQRNSSLYLVKDMEELNFIASSKKMDNETFGEAGFKLSVDKGDYYILNLNGPKKEVSDLSSSYWGFVSDTYRKRLNLTDQEVKDFIKSSKEMENRTTLLVSTEKGKKENLRGGLAFVDSKNTSELLPFEKATGITVKREKGKKVGEIVRFTVDEKLGDRKLSDELIGQLTSYFQSQDKLDKVYIYTSKSHYRLYQRLLKKMGLEHKMTHDLDRDVVLEIDNLD